MMRASINLLIRRGFWTALLASVFLSAAAAAEAPLRERGNNSGLRRQKENKESRRRCARGQRRFCGEKNIRQKYSFDDPHLFPDLNREELAFIFAHPAKALKAYYIGWEAKSLCSAFFNMNDASGPGDACRHFVWAALLHKNFGAGLSKRILAAHEADPDQTAEAKEMDTANNLFGLKTAARLEKESKLDTENIIDAFHASLWTGDLLFNQEMAAAAGLLPPEG